MVHDDATCEQKEVQAPCYKTGQKKYIVRYKYISAIVLHTNIYVA